MTSNEIRKERDSLVSVTNQIGRRLLTFNPEYISHDMTGDSSIFFQTSINDKNIYLEIFIDHDPTDNIEAVIIIYQNKKCILLDGGTIESAFSHIKNIA